MCRLAAHGFDVSPEPWRIFVFAADVLNRALSRCQEDMKVGGLNSKLQRLGGETVPRGAERIRSSTHIVYAKV